MEAIFLRLMNPALIWIFIPIVYIAFSSIVEIVKLYQRHSERMALIRQGIHPDLAEIEDDSLSTHEPENQTANSQTANSQTAKSLRETTGYAS